MCRLQNITMRDYQESVTTGQTDRHTHIDRQKPDKVIPICRYALQATQKVICPCSFNLEAQKFAVRYQSLQVKL